MITSIYSKPALLADLPEIIDLESNFIYNFFSADERTNETSSNYGNTGFTSTSANLNGSTYNDNVATSNIIDKNLRSFYGRNAIYPRFVKISFNKPYSASTNANINAFGATSIARETALNVFGRVGVSIIDTAIDKTIYQILSGTDTATDTVSASTSQRIIDAIKNGLQPDGYRYAITDERKGIKNNIRENLQNLDFGFSYASNVAGSITAGSLNSTKHIYADELSSTQNSLSDIETQTIAATNPYVIRTSDYEAEFSFIDTGKNDFSFQQGIQQGINNTLVGYAIQKFTTLDDGSTKIFSEKIIFNPAATYFLDPDVAYGRQYSYKVLSIYKCEFQVSQRVVIGTGADGRRLQEDRTVTKYALFASKGLDTTVDCLENISPPPPVDLGFRYRGDNTGLNITWNFPVNLQRDIKKFQVFRRRSISEPFQLIKVYDFDDSLVKTNDPENVPERLITRSLLPTTIHKDTEFTKNSKFIYAICAIDAHGLTSNYSVQLEASYDRYRNRINTRVISRSDAPKPYPNIFLNQDTFVDTMKMSGYTKLNIYFNPEYIKITDKDGVDQNHVVFNNNTGDDNTYKLMLVNTDFQQSQTLDIKINDSYVQPPVITPSTSRVFSPT